MIINSFNKDYSSCRRDLQLSEDSVGKLETGIKLPVFLSASASSELFRDLMSDVSEDTTAYSLSVYSCPVTQCLGKKACSVCSVGFNQMLSNFHFLPNFSRIPF